MKYRLRTVTITCAEPEGGYAFRAALLLNATGIILVHNHPSGGAIPSADDDRLTRDMARAGLLIDIPLVDHVIVTPTAEFSYLAAGRL